MTTTTHTRPDIGHWSIAPDTLFAVERHTQPSTLAIETIFTTKTGVGRLSDALAGGEGVAGGVNLSLDLEPMPEDGRRTFLEFEPAHTATGNKR